MTRDSYLKITTCSTLDTQPPTSVNRLVISYSASCTLQVRPSRFTEIGGWVPSVLKYVWPAFTYIILTLSKFCRRIFFVSYRFAWHKHCMLRVQRLAFLEFLSRVSSISAVSPRLCPSRINTPKNIQLSSQFLVAQLAKALPISR